MAGRPVVSRDEAPPISLEEAESLTAQSQGQGHALGKPGNQLHPGGLRQLIETLITLTITTSW